jgi:hypothetical protein
MNLVPAAVFLLFRRRFAFPEREDLIWRNFALAAVALLFLLLVLPSSTAVDRLALYVIPLQLAVWGRVPGHVLGRQLGRVAVLVYAFLIQFTWLTFAEHARFWIPYRAT